MTAVDLLILGSGPAGISSAASYRRCGGGRVMVVSADPDFPYERPPLSKAFLRGETEEDQFALHEPNFYREQDIELRLGESAVELDPARCTVRLSGGELVTFASCVLATGAHPRRLAAPGADDDAVLTLRSLVDGRRLQLAATMARSAVVIGSGFIGCEVAASLAARGLAVTLLTDETLPQSQRLGSVAANRIMGWLDDDNVRVRTGVKVSAITDAHRVQIEGDEATTLADLVVVATGVRPRVGLAEDGGLQVEHGRVVADGQLRTSVPNVLVAGDVAYAWNERAGRRLAVEHWGDALAMGEIAGQNAAGGQATWAQTPGFWTTIGDRVLKYAAWGDGYDQERLVDHGAGRFTMWYGKDARVVGVLAHNCDADYERGRELVQNGARFADL